MAWFGLAWLDLAWLGLAVWAVDRHARENIVESCPMPGGS